MNMLDMHTREKANKIHLDEMHREAKSRYLLQNDGQGRNLENAITKRRLRFALAFVAIVILLGSFLIALTISL